MNYDELESIKREVKEDVVKSYLLGGEGFIFGNGEKDDTNDLRMFFLGQGVKHKLPLVGIDFKEILKRNPVIFKISKPILIKENKEYIHKMRFISTVEIITDREGNTWIIPANNEGRIIKKSFMGE